MGFPLKNGEEIGDTMAVAAEGLWIRGPAGSGKNASVEGEKKESVGDWWSEDFAIGMLSRNGRPSWRRKERRRVSPNERSTSRR